MRSMTHSTVNPPELHDPTAYGYSHTVNVPSSSDLVFVAGQYASGPFGEVAAEDFDAQVEHVFRNVATALDAHQLGLRHVVQLRTYVVGLDMDKLGVVGRAVGAIWGAEPPTHTVIGVAALAMPDIHVEIEAIAARE